MMMFLYLSCIEGRKRKHFYEKLECNGFTKRVETTSASQRRSSITRKTSTFHFSHTHLVLLALHVKDRRDEIRETQQLGNDGIAAAHLWKRKGKVKRCKRVVVLLSVKQGDDADVYASLGLCWWFEGERKVKR